MQTLKRNWFMYLGWVAILLALLLQPQPVGALTEATVNGTKAGYKGIVLGTYSGSTWSRTYDGTFTSTDTITTVLKISQTASTDNSIVTASMLGWNIGSVSFTNCVNVQLRLTIAYNNTDSPWNSQLSATYIKAYWADNSDTTIATGDFDQTLGDEATAASTGIWVYGAAVNQTLLINLSPADVQSHKDGNGYVWLYLSFTVAENTSYPGYLNADIASNKESQITFSYGTSGSGRQMVFQYAGSGVPNAPTNLTVSDTNGTYGDAPEGFVWLEWNDNSDDEDYWYIEQDIDNSFNPSSYASYPVNKGSGTTYLCLQQLHLSNNTMYFRVKAVNTNGSSSWSNTASFDTGMPTAPNGLTLTLKKSGNSNYVEISWNDNSDDETGFYIEREHEGHFEGDDQAVVYRFIIAANEESFNDTTPTDSGTTPFYRVGSYNDIGISWTSEVQINLETAVIVDPGDGLNLGIPGITDQSWFPWLCMIILAGAIWVFAAIKDQAKWGIAGAAAVVAGFVALGWLGTGGTILVVLVVAVAALSFGRRLLV